MRKRRCRRHRNRRDHVKVMATTDQLLIKMLGDYPGHELPIIMTEDLNRWEM